MLRNCDEVKTESLSFDKKVTERSIGLPFEES